MEIMDVSFGTRNHATMSKVTTGIARTLPQSSTENGDRHPNWITIIFVIPLFSAAKSSGMVKQEIAGV